MHSPSEKTPSVSLISDEYSYVSDADCCEGQQKKRGVHKSEMPDGGIVWRYNGEQPKRNSSLWVCKLFKIIFSCSKVYPVWEQIQTHSCRTSAEQQGLRRLKSWGSTLWEWKLWRNGRDQKYCDEAKKSQENALWNGRQESIWNFNEVA